MYEIAGSGLERAAKLSLKLCQQNEVEKHGKSNETKMSDGDGNPTKDVDIVKEFCRVWTVSPTPETVSANVSGNLGDFYSFWDEIEKDGLPIIRIEEQNCLSESANNVFVVSVAGAIARHIQRRAHLAEKVIAMRGCINLCRLV